MNGIRGELSLPALLSHQTSLTKHKVKHTIISNFNIERSTKPRTLLICYNGHTPKTENFLGLVPVAEVTAEKTQSLPRAEAAQLSDLVSKHYVSLRTLEWIWHGKSAKRQPQQRGEESICLPPWPSPGHHAAFQTKLPSNTPQPCHPHLSTLSFLHLLRYSSPGTYQKYIFESRCDLNSSFLYHSYDK